MQRKKANLAALITYTIFGFSFLATRVALEGTNVSTLLAVRFSISVICMSALLLFGITKMSFRGKPVIKLLLLGLSQPVAYFIFETYGIQYTNSSFAGVIISLIPVSSTLMAMFFLKEKVAPRKFFWIFCSIAGVSLLSYLQGSSGSVQLMGIIFMLMAVLSASVFALLSKSISEQFSAFERSYIMMVMGCIAFVSYAAFDNGSNFGSAFIGALTDLHVLLPILYLSVGSSVIAFLLLNYAMSHLEIARATSYCNIEPVISLFAGVVFLSEPISIMHGVACALVVAGVYMVTKED